VGQVGYEINFNRYFYEYEPPRPLEAIEDDLRTLQDEIVTLLDEVMEGGTHFQSASHLDEPEAS
jgi:type I restriction enzyme M protein